MTHNPTRFSVSAYEEPVEERDYLQLELRQLSNNEVRGIYGKKKNELPERMRYLDPLAAESFLEFLSDKVIVSDMYRSAEASLRARRTRRGAQRPGFSGHNFGFSIDLDVGGSIKRIKLKTKKQLDEFMAEAGWYCHRRDHKRDFESWHYNFFGEEFSKFVKSADTRTSKGLERKIEWYYGPWWSNVYVETAQLWLTRLGLYDGDIDNKLGPLTKESIAAFQRAWLLNPSGELTKQTTRTLAFVTADKEIC